MTAAIPFGFIAFQFFARNFSFVLLCSSHPPLVMMQGDAMLLITYLALVRRSDTKNAEHQYSTCILLWVFSFRRVSALVAIPYRVY